VSTAGLTELDLDVERFVKRGMHVLFSTSTGEELFFELLSKLVVGKDG
jgi:hypothetical protein